MPNAMKSVLFVSTSNRYRSPFAEAVFRQKMCESGNAEECRVGSAGTWIRAKLSIIPRAYDKAREIGLDLRGHHSVEVSREILSEYGLIVVMEKGHKEALRTEFPDMRERIFLLSAIVDDVDYDILAPVSTREDADVIIDELYNLLQRGISKICGLADEMRGVQVV